MQQQLITSDDRGYFSHNVNTALRDGWKVVPGTLVGNTAVAFGVHNFAKESQVFMVVLEKTVDNHPEIDKVSPSVNQ